ncbi:MAG: alpha-N-acetylglucosaminidase N-terminal domain-containing protein, partial [Niameybacter sp.]
MKEIKSLISRVLDVDTASKFAIHLEDRKTAHDYFELSTIENQIQVKASNVLAAASGVHWYMKHYLNMNITWCGSQKQTKEPWPVI